MTGDGEVRWSATLSDTRARAAISARRHGVPGTMIESAARRRAAGDWRGACAAADVDVCLNPDAIRRRHGAELAGALLADLRNLAPDLLRWHLPRCGHGDGLLRGDVLVPLAGYAEHPDSHRRLILAAATPGAALAAGQRIVLTVVESDAPNTALHGVHRGSAHRYSLLRHRMFWDARDAPALRELINGADAATLRRITQLQDSGQVADAWAAAGIEFVEPTPDPARDAEHRRLTRWPATVPVNLPSLAQRARAALPGADEVVVRAGGGAVIVLRGLEGSPRSASGSVTAEAGPTVAGRHLPVLPEAAWLRPVDADLLRFGLLRPEELHPLVASALLQNADGFADPEPDAWLYRAVPGVEAPCADWPGGQAVLVSCGTTRHRVVNLDGSWQPIDHDDRPARERLLASLGSRPNPCRRAARHLNAGMHVIDLVAGLLAHGRAEDARRLLRQHADRAAAPGQIVLPDGGTVGEALAALHENTLRLRMSLAEVPPRPDPRSNVQPIRKRRSRKGDPARAHR